MKGSGLATGQVLVGVDGSDPALRAVRWAAAEAARRRVPLRVVNAFGPLPADRPGSGLEAGSGEVLLHIAHELVASAVAHARSAAPDVPVTGEVLIGRPVPLLVAESFRADVVVLGDRGRGGLTGMLVGSVAVALATHAVCPVVVVRGPEPDGTTPPDRPVIVGVGEPPDCDPVLGFAFEAATALGAPLVAVHAWRLPALLHPDAALLVDWNAVAAQEGAALAAAVAPWAAKFPEVSVDQVVVKGAATHALVERTPSALLVVVGTRGHGHLAGTFLGSVSHALLHHASCPVAVVRPVASEKDDESRRTT